jgi:hypothetical protein
MNMSLNQSLFHLSFGDTVNLNRSMWDILLVKFLFAKIQPTVSILRG